MLSTFVSICNIPVRRGSKIHPENIIATLEKPIQPTPKKDPCEEIYARYKEPGAYEQYQKLLTSKTV